MALHAASDEFFLVYCAFPIFLDGAFIAVQSRLPIHFFNWRLKPAVRKSLSRERTNIRYSQLSIPLDEYI